MPWSKWGFAPLLFAALAATSSPAPRLSPPAAGALRAASIAGTGAIFLAKQQSPVPAPAPPPPRPAPPPANPAPQQAVPSAPAAPGLPRFLVVLDAAHGGDDLGGHLSSGQFEKNANLALSVRLRSLLGARGIQVVTTRESDQSLDMNRRASVANHADARACISLHAAETGSGVHLFVSSLAPAPAGRFVAWKTAQAAWVTRSLALAGVLNSALLHAGMTVTLGRVPLPGLENMTCPAVAIEVAPERDSDHKLVSEPDDTDYQARVAATLAAAILEWRTEGLRGETRQP